MFGYVVPDKPNMFIKDFTVYKAFYCGLCKSIGKKCGQMMRFTTNYDITFLAVLAHGILDEEATFNNEGCILAPLKKKSVVVDNELLREIVNINTILAHYKLQDNIIDDNSLKAKMLNSMVVKRHYKRAENESENYDKIVSEGYAQLRELESENKSGAEIIAHPFGMIMLNIAKELFGEKYTDSLGEIMYNVGKWIYCVDAIDDIDDDFKEKKYNVFLVDYDYKDRASFLADNQQELEMLLMSCYNKISSAYDNIKLTRYDGVITNILWYGILQRTKEILRSVTKCEKIRI